ncbi:MAG: hypothetical protein A2Y33_00050 [Spirochaetes bacterium GWF1_51_8]|nr:MAG: hypothetical protein A2Y33_00050 [Spirochaetes bacterium GWF1_51_8]
MKVRPFRGLRPRAELIEKVNVPPYDVVDRDEVRQYIKDNPYSFFHVSRTDGDFDDSVSEHDDRVYEKGKEVFDKFLADGIYKQDVKPGYYLYSQTWHGRTQNGVFICASCDDYEAGTIKKHELTREDKEEDRTHHLLTLGLNTGPVFLFFKDSPVYEKIISSKLASAPEYSFADENGVTNKLWPIDGPEAAELDAFFKKMDNLYIADGHHRAASAYNARKILAGKNPGHTGNEEYNYFLAVVFPGSHLRILPYNRLVLDLNGLTKDELLKKVSEKFDVVSTECHDPMKGKAAVMYIGGSAYLISPKPGTYDPDDAVGALDVSIIQNNILAPILGIDDPRTSKRIKFVGGRKGSAELKRAVDNGSAAVSFCLYPVTVEELMTIADRGEIMPPKSTWFEPKLRSGLVLHSIR